MMQQRIKRTVLCAAQEQVCGACWHDFHSTKCDFVERSHVLAKARCEEFAKVIDLI